MCWLEPLVEVEIGGERYALWPGDVADVPGLFAADFLHNGAHPLQLGRDESNSLLRQPAAPDVRTRGRHRADES